MHIKTIEQPKLKTEITLDSLWKQSFYALNAGAANGVMFGLSGQFSVSFFNPALASCAGSFMTFAGVGALTGCLFVIPYLLKKRFFDEKSFLDEQPQLKNKISLITNTLSIIGGLIASAVILGLPPFGATVIIMMVIPSAMAFITALFSTIAAVVEYFDSTINQAENSSSIILEQLPPSYESIYSV